MHHLLKSLLLTLTLGMLLPVQAADSPNLLVMGDDADEDTIPRNSRVFKRVIASMNSELNDIVDVYDETAITLTNFKQGRVRRTDGELIDIARSVTRPPIDVVAVFSIYASMKDTGYSKKARARVTGKLLNVHSGKFIDNFETSPYSWNVSAGCDNRECILEEMGDGIKTLGQELGNVLATKYDWQLYGQHGNAQRGTSTNDMIGDFYLEFDGFSAEDVMEIEEYLVIFSGYESHRPTEQRHTRSVMLYRSSISNAKLNRNLKKMLAELDMRATISFEGNTYVMKRISLRGKRNKPSSSDGW
ncbi:hypothetical protein [uncultured Paraglaciecola sp.]|uniref:hypothetical protein n=1 Tax=uncultured Paraglaciecola sp. TaxID=1765024 RepID=UPI00261A94B8|nr:hypothetical protein [uncultured Paraglaciecola sp.]